MDIIESLKQNDLYMYYKMPTAIEYGNYGKLGELVYNFKGISLHVGDIVKATNEKDYIFDSNLVVHRKKYEQDPDRGIFLMGLRDNKINFDFKSIEITSPYTERKKGKEIIDGNLYHIITKQEFEQLEKLEDIDIDH